MSLNTNKNSYGATDLEAGTTGSHIKDAAGVGTSRPAQNQFHAIDATKVLTQAAPLRRHCHGRRIRPAGLRSGHVEFALVRDGVAAVAL